MPHYWIVHIHCFKTYNIDGNDSITLKIFKEGDSNSYTFVANNIQANTMTTASKFNNGRINGNLLNIALYLNEPSLIIGKSDINEKERQIRFTNSNADYEISLEKFRPM